MKLNKRIYWPIVVLLLIVGLVSVALFSLSIGEVHIKFIDIPRYFTEKSSIEYSILKFIRIPRTLLGISVGGGLSMCGAILQGVYRNPLVEPYTLGISGGASLGITLVIVWGLHLISPLFLPLAGFIGSITTILIVYFFGTYGRNISINRMLLIGVMISFISSSIMMFLMSITEKDNIPSIIFWIMGSLNESNGYLILLATVISFAGLCASYIYAGPLNALRMGKDKARHLGIRSDMVISILFLITSIVTGVCIAVVGIIGFVGLVIPHIVRSFIGADYRILLISSFLSGGIFLILSDIIARTIISPNELPIGVITGIVGGIVFISILWKEARTKK